MFPTLLYHIPLRFPTFFKTIPGPLSYRRLQNMHTDTLTACNAGVFRGEG